ncbi:SpoIIE family protein phosphatase [Xanthobacter tagetidis]|jgi:sigma-B regulation protein RsbU (phosphoserine phosphatase)|uniref:HAMP domain-containing protein n=1 Tax=Xanthobacter tagetidis TaxID=60216 RepID=A0A3L6ZY67_9HYPH|nr:SpoIIE family protein phosphatase [Xanthobacter tagetidis]MBB6310258.1 sigma-B regulation protein RsbU (phosphoserine phosphatase) [Xanthobacter tagetidis]RLP72645.1 HAMP domain-containing protein [Xanthobacter tagetidis]
MLLRTRITLIVAAGFVALMLAMWSASVLRDRVGQAREGELAIAGQSVLWREIIAFQVASLGRVLDRVDASPSFRLTLGFADRAGVGTALKEAGVDVDDDDTYFEVVGTDREVIYSGSGAGTRSVLDAGSLDRALGGEALGGMRQVSARQIVVLATRTVTLAGRGRAVLVLGRNAGLGMERFARGINAETTLVTLRGRVAASTDPALWERADLSFTPRRAFAEQVRVGEKTYAVTGIPIQDLSGSALGALVSFVDATATLEATSLIRSAAIAGAIGLVLLGVIGLNVFLWYSFRPLESAIDVLQALARGDTSVTVDHAGRDEIGRIASAVVALRGNVQALAEARRQRDRVRRRQETLISSELKALADAIDPTDREQVLALLARGAEVAEEDELKRVARVLHDLSRRIVEQHTRLSSMVVELREALVTKTKLAGLQQELEIARQVQLAILPKEFPPDARVAVHGQMTPAREVGGDFFDYFMIDETTLGLVVADVSGKGVPAALFMAISRTLLRSTALFERSPASSIRRLNDLLAAENEQMLFVTLFYGVLDLNTGRLSYVNAGHNLPYHITRSGEVTEVPSTRGMAVAVLEGFVFAEGELQLAPGDTLFLYTDGVTEAFDIDEQPYGEERLETLLKSGASDWSVHDLSERVLASVHVFERGAPQADDITCLTLRYSGGQGPRRAR